jgi:hypothetical protein
MEVENIENIEKQKPKYKREYYLKFKEKNSERITEKHTCEVCLGTYTYYNKSAHIKSKRHIKFLEKEKDNI